MADTAEVTSETGGLDIVQTEIWGSHRYEVEKGPANLQLYEDIGFSNLPFHRYRLGKVQSVLFQVEETTGKTR